MSSDDSQYRRLPALAPTVLATARILTEASRAVLSTPALRNDGEDIPRPATAA
jgi:hypothetical protein